LSPVCVLVVPPELLRQMIPHGLIVHSFLNLDADASFVHDRGLVWHSTKNSARFSKRESRMHKVFNEVYL